jgi:hypothetical protein
MYTCSQRRFPHNNTPADILHDRGSRSASRRSAAQARLRRRPHRYQRPHWHPRQRRYLHQRRHPLLRLRSPTRLLPPCCCLRPVRAQRHRSEMQPKPRSRARDPLLRVLSWRRTVSWGWDACWFESAGERATRSRRDAARRIATHAFSLYEITSTAPARVVVARRGWAATAPGAGNLRVVGRILSWGRRIVPIERGGVPDGMSVTLAGVRVALGRSRIATCGPAAAGAGTVTDEVRLLDDGSARGNGSSYGQECPNYELSKPHHTIACTC